MKESEKESEKGGGSENALVSMLVLMRVMQ